MPGPVTLRHGDLELVLTPGQGGSAVAFRRGGFDVFHPTGPGDERNRTFYPLVPFSGRVDHARFAFAGREHRLEPNYPPEPHAIHGVGWQSPWRVASRDDRSAILVLDCAGDPFRFRAEQRFSLSPDRLEVRLAVTHAGDAPMPYGLGLHPYFDRRPDSLLSAEVAGVWMPDAGNVPRRLEPVPIGWGFRLRRPVAELDLDHNFQGWSGSYRIDWPDAGLGIVVEADPIFRHLVVFTPPDRPFFAVEPVSHVADGFNLMARGVEGTGVRVLAPGETLAGAVRFRVLTLAR